MLLLRFPIHQGARPPENGATRGQIWKWRTINFVATLLNKMGLPGFVTPISFDDELTGQTINIRISDYFTIISIDGRDLYFHRLNGKFDGTGSQVRCG